MKTTTHFKAICGALIILVATNSCTFEKRAENKLRRAERTIEKLTIKYPQLIKVDTITKRITTIVPEIRVDTSFIPVEGDTVTITKDRLVIRYITRNDSVFIDGECKSDTIYQEVKVPVTNIEVRKQSFVEKLGRYGINLIWIILLIIGLVIGISVVIKSIKPW